MSFFARLVGWIVSAVIGAVFGAAGTIPHASLAEPVPVGLIISAIGCAGILVALRTLAQDRWAAAAGGVGMFAAVLLLSGRGPGGSVLVPDTPLAQIWMVVVGLIILVVVAWPDLRGLRAGAQASTGSAA